LAVEPNNEALVKGKQDVVEARNNRKPQGGMGGMGGMGGGGMSGLFQQMLMSNPGLLQDPEVLSLMQDPAFINKLK